MPSTRRWREYGRETDESVRMRLELVGEPRLGEGEVRIYLLDENDGISGAQASVTGDMTHAGMVPVVAEADELEPGLYATQGFEFTMAGDWLVTAQAELPDGSRAVGELAVTVPGE